MKTKLLLTLLLLITGVNSGCMLIPPSTGGSSDLPDADMDGFRDLPSPDGITSGEDIQVEIVNELTQADLIGLIDLGGLESLLAFVQVNVAFDLTLNYPNGETVPFSDSRSLEPFELRFEAVCPDSVDATAGATASALGAELFSQDFPPITITSDDFECGSLISLRAFLNDRGQPDVDWTVTPL